MELPAKIKPDIIVCLGSTAARAVIGKQHRVLKDRGRFFEHPMARSVTATVHPSAILRAPADYEAVVRDLKGVWQKLEQVARAH